jgi:hypothetical protein
MRTRINRFRYEYQEMPDYTMAFSPDEEKTAFEAQTLQTYEYEGVVGESWRILGRIYDAINARKEQGNGQFSQVVVLGVEEYVAVDAWVRYDSGGESSIEDAISADIVTVPGRMIHVPKKNERAMLDHLKGGKE